MGGASAPSTLRGGCPLLEGGDLLLQTADALDELVNALRGVDRRIARINWNTALGQFLVVFEDFRADRLLLEDHDFVYDLVLLLELFFSVKRIDSLLQNE